MRLSYTDLSEGVVFTLDGVVYMVVESVTSKKSRQKASNQTRIKNMLTGSVTPKTFHASDSVESVNLEKNNLVFLYINKEEAWFSPPDDLKTRLSLPQKHIAGIEYLKEKESVTGIYIDDELFTIEIPITVTLMVKEAPSGDKGNTHREEIKRLF